MFSGAAMKKLATAIAAIALIGTPAFAADMAVPVTPPLPAPVYNWTGFYGGFNVGWSWGKANSTFNFTQAITPTSIFSDSTHPNGAIGGVQIGYNWQATPNWILGLEADIQASGENGTNNLLQNIPATGGGTVAISHSETLQWFGTVRGRVGYAIWPTTMLYATGGLAYGELDESVTNVTSRVPFGGSFLVAVSNPLFGSTTRTGWTAGGGIEGAVPDTHVTWKIEYLYVDLGTANYNVLPFQSFGFFPAVISAHFTDNIVRVGLNYQFH
jgi:outer membrane immunogenic protein